MVKPAFMAGVALTLAGVIAGSWPAESTERSRRLVPTRTYDRRGPTVMVQSGAGRVRDATGQALSVTMLLGTDGYWVRSRPGPITREGLRDTKVLVVDRAWDTVGDRRTTTLLSRWIQAGGSVLTLARGEGPDVRRQVGAGRVAVVDPTAFETTDFVERLLGAMHWLD
jgi:hypothetical protein